MEFIWSQSLIDLYQDWSTDVSYLQNNAEELASRSDCRSLSMKSCRSLERSRYGYLVMRWKSMKTLRNEIQQIKKRDGKYDENAHINTLSIDKH